MKTISRSFTILGSALVSALFCGSSALAGTLLVDNDMVECPDAGFTSIQTAVDAAASGDVIQVCPGTYDEQVEITKPLSLVGVGRDGNKAVVVQPSNMVANTDFGGFDTAAAILVRDTSDVSIKNIILDGINNGVGCEQPPLGTDPYLDGIFYQNSSGEIASVVVRNILTPQGCAQSFAIDFESDTETQLTVRDSSVHDYDQVGILANGSGVNLHAIRNMITGLGPSDDRLFAQTGIQIGLGGKGSLEDNTVINHIFAPCVSPSECENNATGIRAFLTTEDVKIVRNVVGKSQVGIFVLLASGVRVLENRVLDTDVFDGIAVIGDNNAVKGNMITNSDESGVFVQGASNTIQDNTINEAPVGFLVTAGNNFWGNRLFNTLVTKEVFVAGAPSPDRPDFTSRAVMARPVLRNMHR